MAALTSGVRFLRGETDILIVAPHSPVIDGAYQNDLRTGIIAEVIQQQIDCCAVINDRFFKPKGIPKSAENYLLDLFRIDHSKKVPRYLATIREIVDSPGKTLVLWVHGIADDVAVTQGKAHMQYGLLQGAPADLHALIGYGQGGDPKTGDTRDCFSASPQTVGAFGRLLTVGGITTLLTHRESNNFRGRDAKRLNQWFNQLGYDFDQVESIQLEIKEAGFRDSTDNAVKSGNIIAHALSRLVRRSGTP